MVKVVFKSQLSGNLNYFHFVLYHLLAWFSELVVLMGVSWLLTSTIISSFTFGRCRIQHPIILVKKNLTSPANWFYFSRIPLVKEMSCIDWLWLELIIILAFELGLIQGQQYPKTMALGQFWPTPSVQSFKGHSLTHFPCVLCGCCRAEVSSADRDCMAPQNSKY